MILTLAAVLPPPPDGAGLDVVLEVGLPHAVARARAYRQMVPVPVRIERGVITHMTPWPHPQVPAQRQEQQPQAQGQAG